MFDSFIPHIVPYLLQEVRPENCSYFERIYQLSSVGFVVTRNECFKYCNMTVSFVFAILVISVVTRLNMSLVVLPDFIKYSRNGVERWRRDVMEKKNCCN